MKRLDNLWQRQSILIASDQGDRIQTLDQGAGGAFPASERWRFVGHFKFFPILLNFSIRSESENIGKNDR